MDNVVYHQQLVSSQEKLVRRQKKLLPGVVVFFYLVTKKLFLYKRMAIKINMVAQLRPLLSLGPPQLLQAAMVELK